ncbi:tetratricopeptide repeat protein [Streptomyces katsurahamanus]|uniref:tetratricopeptide repeat protein n=1 Tax=Streptomyces katsurahamanus TaxID=2577098 RepID=UPI00188654C0|nr:tetratricopeptide repeat protein [Streptomyces katsurahamanus]
MARGSVAALLAALAVVAPARAVSPTALPPTALVDATAVASCDEARERQQAGELDGAQETYTAIAVKGGDAERACAVAGLKSVAAQREQAAAVVTAGEDLVKAGDLDKAGNVFRSALAMDQSNPGATAGLAQVHTAQDRPGASSNWERFSAYWVVPLVQMLLFSAVGFAVLYALAGLSTRLFVPVDTISWPRGRARPGASPSRGMTPVMVTAEA